MNVTPAGSASTAILTHGRRTARRSPCRRAHGLSGGGRSPGPRARVGRSRVRVHIASSSTQTRLFSASRATGQADLDAGRSRRQGATQQPVSSKPSSISAASRTSSVTAPSARSQMLAGAADERHPHRRLRRRTRHVDDLLTDGLTRPGEATRTDAGEHLLERSLVSGVTFGEARVDALVTSPLPSLARARSRWTGTRRPRESRGHLRGRAAPRHALSCGGLADRRRHRPPRPSAPTTRPARRRRSAPAAFPSPQDVVEAIQADDVQPGCAVSSPSSMT